MMLNKIGKKSKNLQTDNHILAKRLRQQKKQEEEEQEEKRVILGFCSN
ncbi:MAG: hypothetical protein M3251_03955 [Thermoproteota archaeon]|nr:hypothetical protein [Thermoproteota archaeon]